VAVCTVVHVCICRWACHYNVKVDRNGRLWLEFAEKPLRFDTRWTCTVVVLSTPTWRITVTVLQSKASLTVFTPYSWLYSQLSSVSAPLHIHTYRLWTHISIQTRTCTLLLSCFPFGIGQDVSLHTHIYMLLISGVLIFFPTVATCSDWHLTC